MLVLKSFWARKSRLSLVSPRLLWTSALNFMLRASHSWDHMTLSGTAKGTRPGSANALSHSTVAVALLSWLPCTITTTGRESVFTWKTSSLPPTLNWDSKRMVNFSSVTDSAPRRSERLIRFSDCTVRWDKGNRHGEREESLSRKKY